MKIVCTSNGLKQERSYDRLYLHTYVLETLMLRPLNIIRACTGIVKISNPKPTYYKILCYMCDVFVRFLLLSVFKFSQELHRLCDA